METKELESIIEAVLFASGDPISLDKLAEIVDMDAETTKSVVDRLADSFQYNQRGIRILALEDKYQMATNGKYAEYVQRIVEPKTRRPLSASAMEVLAVISYKQPTTRQEVEKVRGVNCDYAITRLLERGLIEEQGRLDAPGKPVLFGTSDEFLRCFGIRSLKDLPELEGLELTPFLSDDATQEVSIEEPLVEMQEEPNPADEDVSNTFASDEEHLSE